MNEPCCCYFANDGPRWRWMDDPAPATPVTAATLVTPETPILRRRRRVILTACGLAAPTVKDHFRSAIPLLPLHFRLIIQSVIKSIPFGSSPRSNHPQKDPSKIPPRSTILFKKILRDHPLQIYRCCCCCCCYCCCCCCCCCWMSWACAGASVVVLASMTSPPIHRPTLPMPRKRPMVPVPETARMSGRSD